MVSRQVSVEQGNQLSFFKQRFPKFTVDKSKLNWLWKFNSREFYVTKIDALSNLTTELISYYDISEEEAHNLFTRIKRDNKELSHLIKPGEEIMVSYALFFNNESLELVINDDFLHGEGNMPFQGGHNQAAAYSLNRFISEIYIPELKTANHLQLSYPELRERMRFRDSKPLKEQDY
ncbi:hypothetical protein GF352_04010 [archaeon]|nr:hypothetical protein [archaeon]